MKDEYDFSQGERGKFHCLGARMNLPIYLDDDVLKYLRARAEAKGMSLSDLVNAILKRDIDLIEAVTEPGGGEGCREAGRIDVSPGEGETA